MSFIDYKIKWIQEATPHKVVRVAFYLGDSVNVIDPISKLTRKEYKRTECIEVKDYGFSIGDSMGTVIDFFNTKVKETPYKPRKELNVDIKQGLV